MTDEVDDEEVVYTCYECGRESQFRGLFWMAAKGLYHCRNDALCEKRSAKERRAYKVATSEVFSPVQRVVSGCLLWRGPKNVKGYGWVQVGGRRVAIHRMVYQIVNGVLGPNEVVRHTCDTPLCIEPTHLLKGTRGDNVQDMWTRGRARPFGRPQSVHMPASVKLAVIPKTSPASDDDGLGLIRRTNARRTP